MFLGTNGKGPPDFTRPEHLARREKLRRDGTDEEDGKMRRDCKLCEGTGKIVLFRSWFTSDGFRFQKCSICGGSGHVERQAPSDWIADQKRIRSIFCVGTA